MNERLKQEIVKMIKDVQKEMFWDINKILDDRLTTLSFFVNKKIDDYEKEER